MSKLFLTGEDTRFPVERSGQEASLGEIDTGKAAEEDEEVVGESAGRSPPVSQPATPDSQWSTSSPTANLRSSKAFLVSAHDEQTGQSSRSGASCQRDVAVYKPVSLLHHTCVFLYQRYSPCCSVLVRHLSIVPALLWNGNMATLWLHNQKRNMPPCIRCSHIPTSASRQFGLPNLARMIAWSAVIWRVAL